MERAFWFHMQLKVRIWCLAWYVKHMNHQDNEKQLAKSNSAAMIAKPVNPQYLLVAAMHYDNISQYIFACTYSKSI